MSHLAPPGGPAGGPTQELQARSRHPGPQKHGYSIEEAAVEVRSLDVQRGKTRILQDIDFSMDSGRITGLLGPSGSGKTTLMRAIVGVQRITAGSCDRARQAGR